MTIENLKSQCILDRSDWDIVFEDEFNYSNLSEMQAADKWYYGYNWENFRTNESNPWEDELYYDDQFLFTGSTIKLIATKLTTPEEYPVASGNYYNFHSGMLRAKVETNTCPYVNQGFTYGLFEIKCKMPAPTTMVGANNNNLWPAFWLYNGGSEIDIFEYHTHDYPYGREFGSGLVKHLPILTSCGRSFDKEGPESLSDVFNTYSLVWEPAVSGVHDGLVTFFFNDRELFTTNSELVPGICPMELLINLAVEGGSTASYGEFEIDYVRVYQKADYTNPYKSEQAWMSAPLSYAFNSSEQANTNLNSTAINFDNSKVFYRGDDNKLHYYNWTGAAWGHYYTDYSQSGTKLIDGDIVSSNTDRIFFRGADGYLHYYNPSGPWTHYWVSTTQLISASPNSIAVVNENNVFFRGSDNKLYNAVYSGGTWGITTINTGATYLCSGDVESTSISQVFYRGDDGFIHYFKKVGGSWQHSWIESSTAPTNTKINSESNSLVLINTDLYYRGNDDKLHRYMWDGTVYNHNLIPFTYSANYKIKGNLRKGSGVSVYYLGQNDKIQYFKRELLTWKHYNISSYWLYDPNTYNYFDVSTIDGRVFFPDINNYIFNYSWETCENLDNTCTDPNNPDHIFKTIKFNDIELVKFSIHPNPANNNIEVNYYGEVSDKNIKIINMLGELVLIKKMSNRATTLDISTIPSGVYTLVIEGNIVTQSQIFVKN